jgi:endonuclease-3
MKKREKAERIRLQLAQLYPTPPIPLDHVDPFSLLVAVMLSAQTTDARVNLVTPALFARAPTPAAMRELSVEEILAFIRSCGLAPTKARNLAAIAQALGERHGDTVPQDMEALEALPGVGHKTASVVLSQAFQVPTFPVDTHIHRLAARWGLSDGSNVVRTEADLKALYASEHWNALHLQFIYFGREHCPALRHVTETCPICRWAAAAAAPATKRDVTRSSKATATARAPRTARPEPAKRSKRTRAARSGDRP